LPAAESQPALSTSLHFVPAIKQYSIVGTLSHTHTKSRIW